MNARQRFIAALRFEPVDRPFRWETLGMWPETLDRWYAEGLEISLKQPAPDDRGAICYDEYLRVLVRAFGLDRVDYLREAVVSGYTDTPFYPPFEKKVVVDEGETRIIQDMDGIIKREFVRYGTSSMPQYLRFPVTNREDFITLLPRLDGNHPQRLASNWEQICAYYADRDFPVGLTICGAFGHPRNLLGVESLCVAYYDQPELIHEILEHWTDFYTTLVRRVWSGIHFDFLLFWEDMAYKGGPLISPRLVQQFMLPYYRRLIDNVRVLGCDIIIVDSDGDVNELVPLFLSVGVNTMLPFEVQAGMDIRAFRKQYGKNLAIIGGLDKRHLAFDMESMEVEIRGKAVPLLTTGGYIPCLDHTVPPNVSLKNFRHYLDLLRNITGGVNEN